MPRRLSRFSRLTLTVAVSTSLFTAACNFDSKETKKTVNEIGNEVQQLTRTVSNYINQAEAPAELKKLQQFEYKVVTFPPEVEATELENSLAELGKERWDCFHVDRIGAKDPALMVMCKRRPDTPLKYVPKTIIGG